MSEGGMAETTAGHNSKARRDVIRDIKTKLDDIDSRIAELQEERKRQKGRIKSDLGWKVADWNVMARFADLEDDPRDVLFDTLREGFAALGVGGQASFLDALDSVEIVPVPAAKKLTEDEAAALGDAACVAGRAEDDFDKGVRSKVLKQAWLRGYALATARKIGDEQRAAADDFGEELGGEGVGAAETEGIAE
jgi:hypothetical protein